MVVISSQVSYWKLQFLTKIHGLFRLHYIAVYLVGGFNPFEKVLVKLNHFPQKKDEHKNNFETTTWL